MKCGNRKSPVMRLQREETMAGMQGWGGGLALEGGGGWRKEEEKN